LADPLSVVVRRRGVVESRHRVHAIGVHDGHVVASAGDGGLVCFLRSSAKPFQALPLARAREDLDDRDLAIASASHLADEDQIAAVRALLAKAPATEEELECGLEQGRPPERLYHNCSGKHAGMLALCRARGWESRGYRRAEHPLQRLLLAEIAAAARLPAEVIPTAVDGCGVVTFAMPLERMAATFSRFHELDGGARVAAAMQAHPNLIRGPSAADSRLMRTLPGWIAKGGAEGLLCAAGPDGIGVALKVEDGSGRAVGPALAAFFGVLGHRVTELAVTPLDNSRGERVGEVVIDP
jgi:L-asparaginase II